MPGGGSKAGLLQALLRLMPELQAGVGQRGGPGLRGQHGHGARLARRRLAQRGEAGGGQGQRGGVVDVRARQQLRQQAGVRDVSGDGAQHVQRVRQRQAAGAADEAGRWLVADHAVQRRRRAHGTAGVAAQRQRRQSRRDGHARAAGRPARRTRRSGVPGIARRALSRVLAGQAEREFRHARLAQDDHALGRQSARGGGGATADGAAAGLRSAAGRGAFPVDAVFHRHRHAMQGAHEDARIPQAVRGLGLRQRAFRRDLAVGGQRGGALDAVQEVQGDLARAQFTESDGARQFAGVLEMQGDVLGRHGAALSFTSGPGHGSRACG
ncbi:hypothetical protein D3C71_1362040 [compost metagenome]